LAGRAHATKRACPYTNEVRVNEVTRDVWDKSHSWTQKKAEAELRYPSPVASPTTRL
jgi:hypothetical protein